jgi:lysophospholipase L1-like esterase
MKKACIIFSLIELVVIGSLIFRKFTAKAGTSVLGDATVARLSRENLVFPTDSEFKYYNTLVSSTPFEETRPWDKTTAKYAVNHDGLNDRYNYNTLKPDGVIRIMTLGDSFTFGHYVDTADNWTERLEDLLNNQLHCKDTKKFEVINLGMRGFDIPYIVKRYNDYGLKYHPDLIIWFESGSGFTRINEIMQPIIQECDTKVASGSYRTTSTDPFNGCYADTLRTVLETYPPDKINKLLDEWLEKFFAIRGKTPTLFAAFASLDEQHKDTLRDRAIGNPDVYMMASISDPASRDGLFPDKHPNRYGHALIAEDIFAYLKDYKVQLLNCR